MTLLTTPEFAKAAQMSRQSAHRVLSGAIHGKQWRGCNLCAIKLPGQSSGKGGLVLAVDVLQSSPALRDLLGLSETPPSTAIEDRLKGRAEAWQVSVAADKYRIITPVLRTEHGSAERAKVIRDLAAQPAHQVGGSWIPVAERTLYDWLKAAEGMFPAFCPRLAVIAGSGVCGSAAHGMPDAACLRTFRFRFRASWQVLRVAFWRRGVPNGRCAPFAR